MRANEKSGESAARNTLTNDRHIRLIVNGCKVKLNFPSVPVGAALGDIKRILLSGVIKT